MVSGLQVCWPQINLSDLRYGSFSQRVEKNSASIATCPAAADGTCLQNSIVLCYPRAVLLSNATAAHSLYYILYVVRTMRVPPRGYQYIGVVQVRTSHVITWSFN